MSSARPVPYTTMPGLAWPAIPHAAGATMLAMQHQLERSQWWTPQRLMEHQFSQLRVLVRHALEHTGYYRGFLDRAGIASPDDLTPEVYRRWPLLSRRDVQQHREAMIARTIPREHGELSETYTSGSTGTPVRFLGTRAAQFFEHAFVLRDHLWQQRDFRQKLGAIRLFAESGTQRLWGPAINAAFATGPGVVLDISTDVSEQFEWILRERPGYLLTTPSNLDALLARSAEARRRPSGLLQVMTYAEALRDGLRDDVMERWGVPLSDAYSSREFGPIALQCPGATHYHVQAENLYVEVLRDDGEPCAAGETGRVVVTGLHNFAMPFLRYEIGDYAEAGEPCACGRGLAVLRRIAGRVTNMAVDPTGRRFWPGLRPSLLLQVAPVRQVRLRQHTPSQIELEYVMDRDLDASEQAGIAAALTELLGYPFEFQLTRVAEISRGDGGKYEDFVSLLKS